MPAVAAASSTLRRNCAPQLRRRPWGRRPENRASVLGAKKQRVVDVVIDAWLKTAGLRGGQVLEASSRTFFVSHTPLPSASAGLQGPVLRDGLGSLVVSPCVIRTVYEMACFQKGELLRQPPPSPTSLRRRYFLSSRRSSHDVAASLLPVVAAPVSPDCRDLLHSALVSGHLCQVRAARHCSFLDSVLEQLTGNPSNLGNKKQEVAHFVTDAWLATAGLRGGQILKARFSTFGASHTLLSSASAVSQGPVLRDGLGSSVVSLCYAVTCGEVSYRVWFYLPY